MVSKLNETISNSRSFLFYDLYIIHKYVQFFTIIGIFWNIPNILGFFKKPLILVCQVCYFYFLHAFRSSLYAHIQVLSDCSSMGMKLSCVVLYYVKHMDINRNVVT